MQYQKISERSKKDDFDSYTLKDYSYFEGDLFFKDPKTPFPPTNPYYQSKPSIANQREQYRTRLIGEIAAMRVAGKDHLKRYMLHKFRNNCKRNTIRVVLTSTVKFLKFIQTHSHSELETLKRSDIEAFVEYEQDRGMSAATLFTRLNEMV